MNYGTDYFVEIPSTFYLHYSEGRKRLRIEMDFRDEFPVLSHRAVVSWDLPHSGDPISDEKRKEILEHIIYYLKDVRGFDFEVDGGGLVESKTYKHQR